MDPDRYRDTQYGQARIVPGKGYHAYYPSPLPDTIDIDPSIVGLLGEAEAALGQLAGVGRVLIDTALLIRPYILREAVASTRIEGTQASLEDVLDAEAAGAGLDADVEEVINYRRAMEVGLARLSELPFSVRLLLELHAILLDGVRGRTRFPGELRTTQNWIGAPGATLETATFVPPPPEKVAGCLAAWERFVHDETTMPVLIQSALIHYQFETIHPFLDGNGRLGRLVVVFHLVMCGRLPSPLLYLSPYLERRRDVYYESLQGVRERGDVTSWLRFFLSAVRMQATDAVGRTQRLVELREAYRERVAGRTRSQAIALVDVLFARPILTARVVEDELDVRRPTALRVLEQLVDIGILEERRRGARNQRRFVANEVLDALTSEDVPQVP